MRPVHIVLVGGIFILFAWLAISSSKRATNGYGLKNSFGVAAQEHSNEVAGESIEKSTRKNNEKLAASPENNYEKALLELAFRQEIKITGTVIDQKNQPIPFAKIKYSINDRILKNPRKDSGLADFNGNFAYSTKARALSAMAEMDGYYSDKRSKASIKSPAEESVTLILTKHGETESLRVSSKGIKLMRDGAPVGVILSGVAKSDIQSADLIVRTYKENDGSVANSKVDPWSWSCEIIVPNGGGIVLREPENRYDFMAPESGYQKTFVHEEPKEKERWSASFEDEFYVKLADLTYARIEIFFTSFNEDPYIEIKSYYNPSGSRNLEFERSKQLK